MPNWVTSYLTVKKEVAEKYILNKENEVDFEILCPMPKEEEENWYDWRIENWGCKWNSDNTYVEEIEDGKVRIEFNTPWCTPWKWLVALREKGFDYHLAWFEEQGYRGIEIAKNGSFIEFELPMVEWEEDENGEYISSEENESFDWRELKYEGEYEELIS